MGGMPATWFRTHRAVQTLTVVLSVVGIICTIRAVDEMKYDHLGSTHSSLGITVGCLMLVQAREDTHPKKRIVSVSSQMSHRHSCHLSKIQSGRGGLHPTLQGVEAARRLAVGTQGVRA